MHDDIVRRPIAGPINRSGRSNLFGSTVQSVNDSVSIGPVTNQPTSNIDVSNNQVDSIQQNNGQATPVTTTIHSQPEITIPPSALTDQHQVQATPIDQAVSQTPATTNPFRSNKSLISDFSIPSQQTNNMAVPPSSPGTFSNMGFQADNVRQNEIITAQPQQKNHQFNNIHRSNIEIDEERNKNHNKSRNSNKGLVFVIILATIVCLTLIGLVIATQIGIIDL